jgi:hypothetical protein
MKKIWTLTVLAFTAITAGAFAAPALGQQVWLYNQLAITGNNAFTFSFEGTLNRSFQGSFSLDCTYKGEATLRAEKAEVIKFDTTGCSGQGAFAYCELTSSSSKMPWPMQIEKDQIKIENVSFSWTMGGEFCVNKMVAPYAKQLTLYPESDPTKLSKFYLFGEGNFAPTGHGTVTSTDAYYGFEPIP